MTKEEMRLKFLEEHPKHKGLVDKFKQAARRFTTSEFRAGRIKKEPCLLCGDTNSEIHHKDYARPQCIIWVCRPHHIELDKWRRRLLTTI